MTEIPCQLVIKHEGLLAKLEANITSIAQDVSYIRTRVDDGLAVKVAAIEKNLAESISDNKVQAVVISSENWFNRILTGSVTKIIGLVVTVILMNALVGTGINLFVKEKYSQELPGQQKQILQKQEEIQGALVGYHSHALPDGTTLLHAGELDKPAWVFDPKKGLWESCPERRAEWGVK